MAEDISHKLVIGISSRALFDLIDSNAVFEQRGVEHYAQYQIDHENEILTPGDAFPLVKKLLNLNQYADLVEVILLSRNSADTGLRIFNSIEHYNLNITRAAFTSGRSPYEYAQAFGVDLFLSTHAHDVEQALKANIAAATLLTETHHHQHYQHQEHHPQAPLRIAFDGDAVLFSDEAERVFQEHGLDAFTKSEKQSANTPLNDGPFKGFLNALHRIQQQFPEHECPIQTALITARQAPAHERVIRTLRCWNIRIDQAIFLGGLNKAEFLKAFQADIFFDDQAHHCASASQHVAAAHVPHGVINNN